MYNTVYSVLSHLSYLAREMFPYYPLPYLAREMFPYYPLPYLAREMFHFHLVRQSSSGHLNFTFIFNFFSCDPPPPNRTLARVDLVFRFKLQFIFYAFSISPIPGGQCIARMAKNVQSVE